MAEGKSPERIDLAQSKVTEAEGCLIDMAAPKDGYSNLSIYMWIACIS